MATSHEELTDAIAFPIEAGHVAMFRRALGDAGATFSAEPQKEEGWVPPTFPQSYVQFDPSYELRPSSCRPWFGSGAAPGSPRPSPTGEGMTLHAEQSFSYERPLVPGEVLTVQRRPGETWTKTGARGGELRFTEMLVEFFGRNGELVVTGRGVSVLTSKTVEKD